MIRQVCWLVLFFLSSNLPSPLLADIASDRLKPVKTDTPQDTMRTFMEAMTKYHSAVKTKDLNQQREYINRAIRTLNLEHISAVLRIESGKEVAIFLKEVIDRVIIIDYDKIPPGSEAGALDNNRWRLKGTEITIAKVDDGSRKGEFLFSPDTVDRAKEFYSMVKDLPYVTGSDGGAGYKLPWIQSRIPKTLKQKVLGIPQWQLIGIFVSIFLGLVLRGLGRYFLMIIRKLANKTTSNLDNRLIDVVEKPISYVIATSFWFLSVIVLRLDGVLLSIFSLITQLAFSISLLWLLYCVVDVISDSLSHLAQRSQVMIDDALVILMRRAMRIFVLVIGTLVAIQNLGINVMSVLAGLGLGGLAFALAAKDTAANLFGSLMILSDQPFKIGDWIKFSDVEGTVEDIGFRSTRVRTFYDSLVTVPNAVVANANIDNMGRRKYRRAKAVLGLTYNTPPERIEDFLEGVKQIIRANKYTRKDYFHVVFQGYGSFSLDILLYFFLEVPTWAEELIERQNIYIEILKLAEQIQVQFAYPTQSIFVESLPEPKKVNN